MFTEILFIKPYYELFEPRIRLCLKYILNISCYDRDLSLDKSNTYDLKNDGL